jgi:hypothetical protein
MTNTNSSDPEPNTTNEKQDTKQTTCAVDLNDTLDNKKAYELIAQWYQAYYLWTTAAMSSALINSSMLAHGARVMAPTSSQMNNSTATQVLDNSQNSSSNIPFVQHTQQQQQQQRVQQHINPIVFYRVPTLFKRMVAEIFDAFCIQIIKIGIALLIINYTDLM